jgi:hypothetical protein
MYEFDFKAALIDFFLPVVIKNKGAIALEVPFLGARRRADVLFVTPDELWAVEIKTEFDNTHGLAKQLEDYAEVFDKVYVATVPSKLGEVRRTLPKDIGIVIQFPNEGFKVVRQAKVRRRLDKYLLCEFVNRARLVHALRQNGYDRLSQYDISELRRLYAEEEKLASIKILAKNSLMEKYRGRFLCFLNERGRRTHSDDLNVLRLGSALLLSS